MCLMKGPEMKGSNLTLYRRTLRALCACALALLTGCGALGQEVSVPELLEPVGVKMDTATAYIGEISDLTYYEASVNPYVEGLSFSVEGVVERVDVILGQQVRAGDVLITLDQDSQNEKLESLRRQIENIEINAGFADEIAQIDRRILELELEALMAEDAGNADAIALKKLDIEAFDLDVALEKELRQLELAGLREELAALEDQLDQKVLTAPFDGTVMYLDQIERGSYISAFTPVIFLADDARMFIETEYIVESVLNSADRLYAYAGSGRYDLTPVHMDTEDYYAKAIAGETIRTAFEFECDDGSVSVGDFAMVCLEHKYVPDALLIPRNALYIEAGSRYVYLVEDGVRVRRDVETGLITQISAQIVEGLEEGAVVYVQE
ncbi:MAG: biotin/lipoyl-binding protein [Clostridiales bacterium]|nr:biotin/lipoyl-binding protein [Clostridiales bacterium]